MKQAGPRHLAVLAAVEAGEAGAERLLRAVEADEAWVAAIVDLLARGCLAGNLPESPLRLTGDGHQLRAVLGKRRSALDPRLPA